MASQKLSVQKALRRKFRRYLAATADFNGLVLLKLQVGGQGQCPMVNSMDVAHTCSCDEGMGSGMCCCLACGQNSRGLLCHTRPSSCRSACGTPAAWRPSQGSRKMRTTMWCLSGAPWSASRVPKLEGLHRRPQ